MFVCLIVFFFFKQKTAYEMRISDWSSDVCSSDLPRRRAILPRPARVGHPAQSSSRWRAIASEGGETKGAPMSPASAARTPARSTHIAASISVSSSVSAGSSARARQPIISDERSEEHTSELQSLMRISYAVFGLKKKH